MVIKLGNTTMSVINDEVMATRVVDSKLLVLRVPLTNSLTEALAKIERISKLDDTMFIMLSEIGKS